MRALLLLVATVSWGQATLSITAPGGAIRAGSSYRITVGVLQAAGTADQAVEFTISLPRNYNGVAAGSAAVAAQKSVQCNAGPLATCVVVGGLGTLIDGPLAVFTLTAPKNSTGLVSIPSAMGAASPYGLAYQTQVLLPPPVQLRFK